MNVSDFEKDERGVSYMRKHPDYDYVVCRDNDSDPDEGAKDVIMRLEQALELAPDLKEKFKNRELVIVDLGCGKNYLVDKLRREGFKEVYGIDINQVADMKSVENFVRVDIQTLENEVDLPFELGGVDLAVSTGILDLRIYPKNQQATILKQIHRLLRVGGAYFSVMIDLNSSLKRKDQEIIQILNDLFEVKYLDEETGCIGLLVKK